MTNNPHGPVVIGMDGSVEATRAADYGAWESHRRGVPLRLVFAHQPTPMWGPNILIASDYEWDRDWVRAILTKAEKQVIVYSSGPHGAERRGLRWRCRRARRGVPPAPASSWWVPERPEECWDTSADPWQRRWPRTRTHR